MNIVLWLLQVLLALAFLAHGWLFLFPPAAIVEQMNASLPRWFQLFLGVAEVMAAVGLTLPGLTRIQPWLVPAAAVGIMIVLACATAFHASRGEVSSAIATAALLAVATFVAYMRWRVAPIPPRREGATTRSARL
jgi:putative oxidoreductase